MLVLRHLPKRVAITSRPPLGVEAGVLALVERTLFCALLGVTICWAGDRRSRLVSRQRTQLS